MPQILLVSNSEQLDIEQIVSIEILRKINGWINSHLKEGIFQLWFASIVSMACY